jgi:hypothetical protein
MKSRNALCPYSSVATQRVILVSDPTRISCGDLDSKSDHDYWREVVDIKAWDES